MKMYLFESNYNNHIVNGLTFTQLVVLAEDKKEAFQIAEKNGLDFTEFDLIYHQKWNYPLYDYETLYHMLYQNKKEKDINTVTIIKPTEEEALSKWNKLFNNTFFTIYQEPKIKAIDEGFLLEGKVIPFNAFNKLLAISYKKGEYTAMCVDGEIIEPFKVGKIRQWLYPMNIKNANSLIKQSQELPEEIVGKAKNIDGIVLFDKETI